MRVKYYVIQNSKYKETLMGLSRAVTVVFKSRSFLSASGLKFGKSDIGFVNWCHGHGCRFKDIEYKPVLKEKVKGQNYFLVALQCDFKMLNLHFQCACFNKVYAKQANLRVIYVHDRIPALYELMHD